MYALAIFLIFSFFLFSFDMWMYIRPRHFFPEPKNIHLGTSNFWKSGLLVEYELEKFKKILRLIYVVKISKIEQIYTNKYYKYGWIC